MNTINEFIKDYYPTLSVIALFIIIALLACSLFCKKKDFTIGIKKEFVIWGTLICSLIALCRTFPTSPCFDYMGIIVGILSLLVTVLMGWNIYTIIDTKSEVAKLKEERSRLQEYVKANRNYAIGITNFTNQKYGIAIGFLCSTAVKLNKINETEAVKDCLDIINNAIKVCKSRMGDISYLETMYKKTKFDFNRIDDERIETISKAIEDIITPQTEEPQSE